MSYRAAIAEEEYVQTDQRSVGGNGRFIRSAQHARSIPEIYPESLIVDRFQLLVTHPRFSRRARSADSQIDRSKLQT